MRKTRGAIFKTIRLDDGRIRFEWKGYAVTFTPIRCNFSIMVYSDEQPIDYRPEFWGAANRINALRLLERAIENLKTA